MQLQYIFKINFKIYIYLAIAEHSICHPGLPGPHGESHEGSPGFAAFHKAKSRLLFLNECGTTSGTLINFPYLLYLVVLKNNEPFYIENIKPKRI